MLVFINKTPSASPFKAHFHMELFMNLERLTQYKGWSCTQMPMERGRCEAGDCRKRLPRKLGIFASGAWWV